MPRFNVAHISHDGQDIILIPLDRGFESKSADEKNTTLAEFQERATAAGLRGHVALAWESTSGDEFFGPKEWHAFFESITFDFVIENANRELYW